MKFYSKFKIRVVYKSGYYHDLWVWKFEINSERVTWSAVGHVNKPLKIGFNDISAVYQIAHKAVFKFTSPF